MVKYYSYTGGQPAQPVGTAGGGAADMSNHGVTVLTSGASTWCLEPPVLGCRKILTWTASGTSNARVVRLSTTSSGDSITLVQGGTGGVAATEIVVATTDSGSIELLGLSSVAWRVIGATTGHSAPSTGLVFQAS